MNSTPALRLTWIGQSKRVAAVLAVNGEVGIKRCCLPIATIGRSCSPQRLDTFGILGFEIPPC